MSDHARKQIRDYVRGRIAGLDALGLSVYTDDGPTVEEASLPAGYVLTRNETSERANKSGTMMREIELVVAIEFAAPPEQIDDEADFYALAIETDLDTNPPPAAMLFELTATEIESFTDEDGAQWFGALALVYRAMLYTEKGDPSTLRN